MARAPHNAHQRSRKAVDDWLTWAVRGLLVALGSFILWQVRSVQTISEDVAVVKTIVASHDKQIHDIWEHLGKKH